jgi:hypothetical protein
LEASQFRKLKTHPYDLIVNLTPEKIKFRMGKYYLAIFHPSHHFFEEDGSLKKPYQNYDGYLLTYSPNKDDPNFANGSRPYLSWYPTVHFQPYQRVTPHHLFYLGCMWGDRFNDVNCRKLIHLIDQEPYTQIYGNLAFQALCPKCYSGPLPFDSESVIEKARQCGITLVLHSKEHLLHGLPSGRIFEAAASSSIILSDENSFVRQHFGDAVLYLNTAASPESIHRQIQEHMTWIEAHPEEALAKAQRAHEIYTRDFLLEDQLRRLALFHEKRCAPTWREKMHHLSSCLLSWKKKITKSFQKRED